MPNDHLTTKHIKGRCYCGDIAYELEGEGTFMQCHCRECQYISGGHPNAAFITKQSGFKWLKGTPQTFARTDLETPRTRLFCSRCGTSLATLSPRFPDAIILKVGTFDDPSIFHPEFAQFTVDKQPFHTLPQGAPAYVRTKAEAAQAANKM